MCNTEARQISSTSTARGKTDSFWGSLGRPQSINAYPGHGAQRHSGVLPKSPEADLPGQQQHMSSVTGFDSYPIQVSLMGSAAFIPHRIAVVEIHLYKYTNVQVYKCTYVQAGGTMYTRGRKKSSLLHQLSDHHGATQALLPGTPV